MILSATRSQGQKEFALLRQYGAREARETKLFAFECYLLMAWTCTTYFLERYQSHGSVKNLANSPQHGFQHIS